MRSFHYSMVLHYKCHTCLSLSATKAYRQLNQSRLEYIYPQAKDDLGWILECMECVEIEEKDVWINGMSFIH